MTKPRPFIPATLACHQCGVKSPRKSRQGQRPKWCSQRCADLGKYGATRTCNACGVQYFGVGKQFCSRKCCDVVKTGVGPDVKDAYERSDWAEVLRRLREAVVVDARSGCWIWTARFSKDGYPVTRRRNGVMGAHRLALEAALGARLGKQAAHHKCANITCINPDHLQPVTAAQNMAEMLARRAYVRRIRDLETALAALEPTHPLLAVAPVA